MTANSHEQHTALEDIERTMREAMSLRTSAAEKNTDGKGAYAAVNDLEMYYEIHGTGQPLVVLPGGLMTIGTMGPMLQSLAASRQVIAVELQAHGRTVDVERPLTYEQLADDTAALIKQLGLEHADVLGFSLGARVALQTAIRHPELVRKLVVAAGIFKSDGEYPEIQALVESFHPDAPFLSQLREAYSSVAARPEDWPQLVAKMRQLLMESFDWTQDVAAIQAPTLLVVGDADTVRPAHAIELFELLGGGKAESAMGNLSRAQLAVLPGTTHFSLLTRVELLTAIIPPFLDAPVPVAG